MPRFKLLIEYAGTRYSGWQIQKNARTVQGEIDRAVREVSRRREFELYGSGRTDAGVHALAQGAHLELYTDLPPESLRRKINDELPADIHIRAVEKAPHRFHARHDALARCYLYQISRRRTAFGKPYVWWIRESLDVDVMRAAAESFVGMKDFEAFTADDADENRHASSSTRSPSSRRAHCCSSGSRGRIFSGRWYGASSASLRHADAASSAPGCGGFLDDSGRNSAAPAALAAPAAGLFLEAVLYKGDRAPGPVRAVMAIE